MTKRKTPTESFSRKVTYWLGVAAVGMVVGLSLQFARAWVEPGSTPPAGNVAGPITTGPAFQEKTGNLGAYSLLQIRHPADMTRRRLVALPTAQGTGLISDANDGIFLALYDGIGTRLAGSVYGDMNSTRQWFGLRDANNNFVFLSKLNDYLRFRINNSDKMTILNNGNVGIGTTDPRGKLDIAMGSNSVGSGGSPIALGYAIDGGGYRHWIKTRHNAPTDNDNSIEFWTNTGNSAGDSTGPGSNSVLGLAINNGNVGIGTTNPGGKLSVNVPANSRGIESLTSTAGNTHLPWSDNWNYISGNGVIFRDASNIEKVRIDTVTGNVGIGTSSPNNKLEVQGTAKITGSGGPPFTSSTGNSLGGATLTGWKGDSGLGGNRQENILYIDGTLLVSGRIGQVGAQKVCSVVCGGWRDTMTVSAGHSDSVCKSYRDAICPSGTYYLCCAEKYTFVCGTGGLISPSPNNCGW